MISQDLFDRSRLSLLPLAERKHDLDLSVILDLQSVKCRIPELKKVARHIQAAHDHGASVILMMGAHVIRAGVQRYIIDLIQRGSLSCVALNGAGLIHDYEFSLIGATTESVSRYISEGQFGLWRETAAINEVVSEAAKEGLGLGEAVGKAIEERRHPRRDISVLATAYRFGVPLTVHVGIGYDIAFQHPNCDGGAYGTTSYRDFLRFTRVMEGLERGVVMNFGSAIMAPEVYLKALAMVRNVAHAQGQNICHFTTLVCDLQPLPSDYHKEPPRSHPGYYFRPWKTMLVRTVADGGRSFYVCGDHADTFPQLWAALSC